MAHTTSIAYWTTTSDLGVLTPGQAFSFDLSVSNADSVRFISGTYPGTLTIDGTDVTLSGDAGYFIDGKDYEFTLRAYHDGDITEQNFFVTVEAIDPVTWSSPENLGYMIVGSKRFVQLNANYDQTLEFELISGGLPPGLFLDSTGWIYGIVGASDLVAPTMDISTWTVQNAVGSLGGASYEFTVRALHISDRSKWSDRTFNITLMDSDQNTADTTFINSSEDLLTVDASDYLLPIVLTKGGTLPTVRHDNQYITQIKAWDPYGRGLEWAFINNNQGYDGDGDGYEAEPEGFDGLTASQPTFLKLERFNGYISGQLPFQRYNRQDYEFTIRIRRVDALTGTEFIDTTLGYDSLPYNEYDGPDSELQNQFGDDPLPPPSYTVDNEGNYTDPYDTKFAVDTNIDDANNYVLPVKGDGDLDFDWYDDGTLLPVNSIKTFELVKGVVSEYGVHAVWRKDPTVNLYYELVGGSLPSGLNLTPFGTIVGHASYRAPTRVYTFEVSAYDPGEEVLEGQFPTSTTRTFKIDLQPAMAGTQEITEVYDSYYRAYMPVDQRVAWQNIVTDSSIFPNTIIYRQEDINFGRRYDLEFLAIPGISEFHAAEFIGAVSRNFSYKRFGLGVVHATTVYDSATLAPLYDVVYVDVVDTNLTADLRSVPAVMYAKTQRSYVDSLGNTVYTNVATADMDTYLASTTDLTADATSTRTVFPASIKTQRERLRQGPGQATDSLLPRWLTSPQSDGRPLGMIPAAVLAYVKVGTGAEIVRKIRRSSHNIKALDFHVDRLVLKDTPVTENPTTFNVDDAALLPTRQPTTLDGGLTTFDVATVEDKYIMFDYDGEIYGNN